MPIKEKIIERFGNSSTQQVHHKWSNVRLVAELIFFLPFTNSKVERTFSTMKVVKTDRRTSLNTDTVDDLNVEGPSLDTFFSGSSYPALVVRSYSQTEPKA